MAHNWQIAGHKKQLEFLSKSLDRDKIAHAYIFAGPESVGKRAIARNFAKILTCERKTACSECANCKSFARGINPDLMEFVQDETIKIEQIRKLIYRLNLKPYQSRYKVAILDRAEDMTIEAANALLKSMEEPKDYTIVILVTSNPYRLLPTILSRAQKVSFGLVSPNDYEGMLPDKLSKEQKLALETYAYGRPGIALSVAMSDDSLEKLDGMAQTYVSFMEGDLADRLKLAADVAEAEDVSIKNTLDFWLTALERELMENSDPKVLRKAAAVANARKLVDANVSTKLLLTQMMLD